MSDRMTPIVERLFLMLWREANLSLFTLYAVISQIAVDQLAYMYPLCASTDVVEEKDTAS